ncbi:hypothetical protein SKAU_G00125980 [Synaphobranchus kaupii]|uniref:Uncharacterized protein n=1 Tax=Synaphobranchus kaupii TaxID=118154 RepID=A0A9Q1J0R0_SYNKA|nr:hypothetical protein SKAU_G00125980 [Synaphobranchus kaupii]
MTRHDQREPLLRKCGRYRSDSFLRGLALSDERVCASNTCDRRFPCSGQRFHNRGELWNAWPASRLMWHCIAEVSAPPSGAEWHCDALIMGLAFEPSGPLAQVECPMVRHACVPLLLNWPAWGGAVSMAEPRHQSSSSLQRKKPPWLKLDIPPAQVSLDETPTFIQPVKRQGFLRSISMPVENTHLSSPPCDPRDLRRIALQRQPSITQTIKSSKRVHFERINTVPIKGQRAGRRVPRRRQSLSKIFLSTSTGRSHVPQHTQRLRCFPTPSSQRHLRHFKGPFEATSVARRRIPTQPFDEENIKGAAEPAVSLEQKACRRFGERTRDPPLRSRIDRSRRRRPVFRVGGVPTRPGNAPGV